MSENNINVADALNPSVQMDRNFLKWLKTNGCSILVSSYKTHKILSLGWYLDQTASREKLSIWLTDYIRPLGISYANEILYINTLYGIWKHVNNGQYNASAQKLGLFTDSFVPRQIHCSGDIDAHDIAIGSDGTPYFCSALYNCIGIPSNTHCLQLYWSPPWISKIAAEDRCHLNGICCRDGIPYYITSVCKCDIRDGWRENRIGKGVVYDIVNDTEVCSGLTMPHSPRWYNGTLWILEAGTGWFGFIDLNTKKFVQCAFIPSFLRGLSFISSGNNNYAIIGGSKDRYELSFKELPLGKTVEEKNIVIRCGIWIINLESFDIIHHLYFDSPIDEIYDVCVLEGKLRPMVMDLNSSSLCYNIQDKSIS